MANPDLKSFVFADCNPELGIAVKAIEAEITIKPETGDRKINEWIEWLEDSSFDTDVLWNEIKKLIDQQPTLDSRAKNKLIQLLHESREFSFGELLINPRDTTHEPLHEFISALLNDANQHSNVFSVSGGGKAVQWIDHHPASDSATVIGVGLTLAAIGYHLHTRRQANRAQAPEEPQRAIDEVAQQAPDVAQRDNKPIKNDDRVANLIDKAHDSGGETLKNIDFINKKSNISPIERKDAIYAAKDKFIQDLSKLDGRANKQNEIRKFAKARQRYLGQNDDNIINLKTNNEGKIKLSDEIFYKPYNPAKISFSPSTSKLDNLLKGISYNDIQLTPIVRFENEKGLEDKMMISYHGRYFVRIKFRDHDMLMYKSSGTSGKPWPKDKWYLVNGIGRDGWINKDDNALTNLGDRDINQIGELIDERFFNDNLNYDQTGKQLRLSDFFQKASDDDGIKAAYMKAINKGCTPTELLRNYNEKNLYGFDTNSENYDLYGKKTGLFEQGSKLSLKKYITIQYPNQPDLTEPHNLPAAIKECSHEFTSYAVDDADIIRHLDLDDYSLDNAGNYCDHISKYFNSNSHHLRGGAITPSKIQEERGKFRTTYLQNEGFEFPRSDSMWQRLMGKFSEKYGEVRPDSDSELYKDFKWRFVIEKDPATVVRDFCGQCKFNIQVQNRFQNSAFKDDDPFAIRGKEKYRTREPGIENYIDEKYWKYGGEAMNNLVNDFQWRQPDYNVDLQRADVQLWREKIIEKLGVLNESRFSAFKSQLNDAIEFLEYNNKDDIRSDKIAQLKRLRLALVPNDGESSITDDDRLGFLRGASPDAQEFLRGVKYDGIDTGDDQSKINYIRRELETDPELSGRLDALVNVHIGNNKPLGLDQAAIENNDLRLDDATLERLDRIVLTHQQAAHNAKNYAKPLIDDRSSSPQIQPQRNDIPGDQRLIDHSSSVDNDKLLHPEQQFNQAVTKADHTAKQDVSKLLNKGDSELKDVDNSLVDDEDAIIEFTD